MHLRRLRNSLIVFIGYVYVQYACRKTLADRRVRVRGRFARNTELSDQEIAAKKIDSNHTCKDQRSEMCCSNDAVQVCACKLIQA